MPPFLLLLCCGLTCAAASLTVFKAPTLWAWKLAIVAGEFGAWLVPVPLLLAVLCFFQWRRAKTEAIAGIILAAAAVGFLLVPAVHAARMARTIPAELEASFGNGARAAERVFSPATWLGFHRRPTPVTHETHVFLKTPERVLSLDLFRPATNSPAPLVVVIHGGGWDGGDRSQFRDFNSVLAGWGYVVAAVDYRLAPQSRWPAQKDDVVAALRYLRDRAEMWGIDPERVVLFGRSAGGQLALAVAYDSTVPGVRGVISFYGPADLEFAWLHTREADLLDSFKLMRQYLGGSPTEVPEQFQSASPYKNVATGAVPTLLAHGRNDALVWHRQSERLLERLRQLGNRVYFLDLPWATHAFDYARHGPGAQLSDYCVRGFLAACLSGSADTLTRDAVSSGAVEPPERGIGATVPPR